MQSKTRTHTSESGGNNGQKNMLGRLQERPQRRQRDAQRNAHRRRNVQRSTETHREMLRDAQRHTNTLNGARTPQDH